MDGILSKMSRIGSHLSLVREWCATDQNPSAKRFCLSLQDMMLMMMLLAPMSSVVVSSEDDVDEGVDGE